MPGVISFYLIDKHSNHSDEDITIVISKSKEKGVRQVKVEGGRQNPHSILLDAYDLEDYIATFVKSITQDTAGCEEVQINCPGFQSVIYSVEQLRDDTVTNTILNMVRLVSRSWGIEEWAERAD